MEVGPFYRLSIKETDILMGPWRESINEEGLWCLAVKGEKKIKESKLVVKSALVERGGGK